MPRKSRVEFGIQRLIVSDTRLTGTKSHVGPQFRGFERADESVPEFFERGEVNGDEPLVGRAQNVSLCEPRAIARSRRCTEREKRGKRFNRKMRHRLEHRHL